MARGIADGVLSAARVSVADKAKTCDLAAGRDACGLMEPDVVTALREQLAKEKATSRDNLKKVMKVTQEKKALELLLEEQIAGGGSTSEAEVAALSAQAEQLQWQLSAKTAEAKELEEELEGAKEEVEPATRLGEPNADT